MAEKRACALENYHLKAAVWILITALLCWGNGQQISFFHSFSVATSMALSFFQSRFMICTKHMRRAVSVGEARILLFVCNRKCFPLSNGKLIYVKPISSLSEIIVTQSNVRIKINNLVTTFQITVHFHNDSQERGPFPVA